MKTGYQAAVFFIVSLAAASIVSAGPIDNARQFQEKAISSASRGSSAGVSKPSVVIKKTTGTPVSTPAKTKNPETKKEYSPGYSDIDKTTQPGK